MQGRSGNEEYLEENDTKKLNSSSKEGNENKDPESPSSSATGGKSKIENVVVITSNMYPEITSFSLNQIERNRSKILLEQTSTLPADHINEKIETVKQKTFKLPAECEGSAPSSELEPVGDDLSKKNEVRILCECEPTVAGAAVPAVKSFTPTDNLDLMRCNKSNCNLPENNLKENDGLLSKSHQPGNVALTGKETTKQVSKIGEVIEHGEKESNCCSNTNRTSRCSQQYNQCLRPAVEKQSLAEKGYPKKPSLIPKPTRSSASNGKYSDKEDTEKRDNVTYPRTKPDLQKHFPKSGVKIKEPLSLHLSKSNTSNNQEHKGTTSNVNTISSRMMGLQERLKATTSMLRQKIELDRTKEKPVPEKNFTESEAEEETNTEMPSSSKSTVDELYRNIASLKDIALALSENDTLTSQTKYIEKLFRNISDIKMIADKLCMRNEVNSKQDSSNDTNDTFSVEKKKSSSTNTKDNKIYIKFIHSKDRKCDNRKKTKESSPDQSEEVQTDPGLSSKLTSDSLNSDSGITEKAQEENKIKEADSMDGVFIPSWDPPINMEEEEETNGLDITITFPEFSQLYTDGAESHLSVCLSDISAEALKKLKRCPKDFTLRMDFVEGKVLFQSGKGPANNFQIGADLKFAEDVVDTKKSDVISIKPSTECSYGSQLIPVENPIENKSYKSLKSTDSELFNVVSLPFLYQNPYLATTHKSCITFRNDHIMSMAILAKQFFKSMPQIPSLTNIFEDKLMESQSKTAFQIQERRRKNRQNQKKRTSSSSVL